MKLRFRRVAIILADVVALSVGLAGPALAQLPALPGHCTRPYYTGGGNFGSDITIHNCSNYYFLVSVSTSNSFKIGFPLYKTIGIAPHGTKKISVSLINMVSSPGAVPTSVVFERIR